MAIDADVQYPHYFELFDSIIYLGSQKKFKEQLREGGGGDGGDLMTEKVKTVAPDDPARAAGDAHVAPPLRPRAGGRRGRQASSASSRATTS